MSPADARTDTLADRYGRPRRANRWTIRISVALVALIGVAWVVWAAWGQSHDQVSGTLTTYHVQSDRAVQVTVTINPDGAHNAVCTVLALASDHSTVGLIQLHVSGGTTATETFTRIVKTERRATSAQVSGCR